MTDNIQKLDDIAPMASSAQDGPADPVGAEYEQGKKLLESGETGQAAVALHNALVGFEEKRDENGMANAANQLGLVCIQRGEYEKALEHFKRAEKICRKIGDPMSLAWLAKQFVVVYTETEQYKKAIERCLDLLDHYQANNNPQGTVDILEQMAEVYIKSGDMEKAADAYGTIASIHQNFKHNKIAESYLEKAEQVRPKV